MKRILLLSFLFGYLYSFAQSDLVITLKTCQGYGPFAPHQLFVFPSAGQPDIKNVPKDVARYRIRQIDFQSYNRYYSEYAAYGVSREEFIAHYDKFDTTLLTDKKYRHTFNVLLGRTISDSIIVIIDANNNLSFDDDRRFVFPEQPKGDVTDQLANGSASMILPLEFYDGASVVSRKTTVIMNPYKGNWEVHYPDSAENRYFLGVSIPFHKEGECRILNKVYKVYLSNQFTALAYNAINSNLLLFPASAPPGKESNGSIPFEAGDIITVDGLQYKFSSVSGSGNTLHLKYIGRTSRPEGFTENFYVPEMKGRTIGLEDFRLSQLKGKYVLLDFWGTWCNPCIQLIPAIKDLNDKFQDKKFAMVSVANDSNIETVKKFVRDHHMDWINIYQNERGIPADADLIKKMKISVYPTTVLIDPDGKIISRGKRIEDIGKVLNEVLK